jgi:hypothetical protein
MSVLGHCPRTITKQSSPSMCYFIEVDRGTEGSRALERQLRAYLAYYRSGAEQAERGVFPRVLWLAPDERRVEAIADGVQRLQAHRELFQVARFEQAIEVLISAESLDPDIPPMI